MAGPKLEIQWYTSGQDSPTYSNTQLIPIELCIQHFTLETVDSNWAESGLQQMSDYGRSENATKNEDRNAKYEQEMSVQRYF